MAVLRSQKGGEMPEEKETAKVEQVIDDTGLPESPVAEMPSVETTQSDPIEESVEELKKKLQNKAEEAARLHKKVERFETEEAERKKAAMSETERLQAELDAATRLAKELETKQAQMEAADKTGLPRVFADRLKGETPEELEADAKALLDSMPKGAKSLKGITSPPEAGQKGMTDDDRRKFLFG